MEVFRKYKLLLPLVICLVITIGMGLFLLIPQGEPKDTETEPETGTETDVETEPTETEDEIPPMPALNFKSDLSAYEAYMNVPAGSYLMLVNKQNPLSESYVPDGRISVKDTTKDITLVEAAEKALEAMFIEMRAAGFKNVFVTSAYRSYSYQNLVFNTYITNEMKADRTLSEAEAREKVLRYSAAPGTSEHQTGLCVDLMVNTMTDLDETFADYPVYDWLLENAWKFGFILRFPEDKTHITGYDFEPWHYRFVGRDDAYMIYARGLCLEEYVAEDQ